MLRITEPPVVCNQEYRVTPGNPLRLVEATAAVEATATHEIVSQPPFCIDTGDRRVLRDGVPLNLTRREYELTLLLFRHVGQVLSRGYILDAVWGGGDTTTRTVDMHVSRVRKVLGLSAGAGLRLTAVYGRGYRLEPVAETPDRAAG